MTAGTSPYRPIALVLLATGLLLLIPLVAMQFSSDVVWSPMDFIVAGCLLAATGVAYVLVTRRAHTVGYKAAAALALATSLLLVWSNLAVGLIGSERNPANLMYFGVLAVEIIGAAVARFRPRGMARTLLAAAAAQGLIALVAASFGLSDEPYAPMEILAVNLFFISLFVGAAALFRRAAERPAAGSAAQAGKQLRSAR